jgi:peptidyl-prolyl cis-trans isomerase B (cyclophilin B)
MIATFRIVSRCCILIIVSRGLAASGAPGPLCIMSATFHPREVTSMIRFLLSLGVAVVLLAAPAIAQDKARPGAAKPGGPPGAIITLEKGGEIRLELFPADAPRTVENFLKLAREGFYDGTTFHRVEPGFVVQGGDPLSKSLRVGDPKIGTGGPGYRIKAEFNKQKHVRGVVAMARAQDPDSAGSQFYITLAPAHFLDGQYTVFGRVVSGMDVVDGIKAGDRMKSVRVTGR